MNVDHLLKIVQQPYVDLASRYGYDAMSEIYTLESCFRYACMAELSHIANVSLGLETMRRSIVLSNTQDNSVQSTDILKDISVILENEEAVVYLEKMNGTRQRSSETSLWFACTTAKEIVTGERGLTLLSQLSRIEDLISNDGKLKKWPRKRERQMHVLLFLQGNFECGVKYTEKEVNEKITALHSDFALIRRALVSEGYLVRTKDGAQYWREG